MKVFTVIALLTLAGLSMLQAQYAPGVGSPGTTAISADSLIFTQWATACTVQRGPVNIADSSLGMASVGQALSALGKPDNDVVSLGDGGEAVLHFASPLYNGPGWDFAVFENSFDGHFLELAFVEVSSDGQHFFRFPAHSLTPDSAQIGSFGTLEPTKIHHLAGKYKAGYGVPFDLQEMKNIAGLDVNYIVAVKVVDVVGSIDTSYCRYDTANNKINDPWPTPFASSGFDLDGVGAIHCLAAIDKPQLSHILNIYPLPAHQRVYIRYPLDLHTIRLFDLRGRLLLSAPLRRQNQALDLSMIKPGCYIAVLEGKKRKVSQKISLY